MFELGSKVGRLCELRFGAEFDPAEIVKMRTRMSELFSKQTGKLVFCTDLRPVAPFTADGEKLLIGLMRADNPRILRSGFLVPKGGRLAMQVLRMVGETDSRARRVFHERAELESWLAGELTGDEQQRLRVFLDGSSPT